MVSDKKIAILGLDNAGKTSIITAMKKKFDIPAEIKGLKPTKRIDRSSFQFMDHIIYLNDFGGQQHYIDEYLRHKVRYLSGIDLLYYAIDIQDSLRFDESLNFFKEVVGFFKEIEKTNVPITIFLHKTDPKISKDPTIEKNINILKQSFRPYMSDFQIRFYNTTIFDISSVINAFSNGIMLLYSQHEVLQKFIDDTVDKMENVMSLMLFDMNGIELASYFLEHITLEMKKKLLTLYEMTQKRIVGQKSERYEFSDRLDAFTKVSGVIQQFNIEGLAFYLLLVLEEHEPAILIDQLNFFEQSIGPMHEILQTILLDDLNKEQELNPI
jgi:GTPase SAR1 family protein